MKLFITSNAKINKSDICIFDNCGKEVPFKAKYKLFFWIKYKLNEIALEYQSPRAACLLTFKVLTKYLLRNIKRRNKEIANHFVAISIDIKCVPKISNRPIKVKILDVPSIWVSRSATMFGVETLFDGVHREIEFERPRIKKMSFVWMDYPKLDDRPKKWFSKERESRFPPTAESYRLEKVNYISKPSLNQTATLKVSKINDAHIYNGFLIHKNQVVYEHDEFGSMSDQGFPSMGYTKFKNQFYMYLPHFIQRTIPKAIFIGSSTNWCHFLTQQILRLTALNDDELLSGPIILRDGIPPQMIELVRILSDSDPVIALPNSDILVHSLLTVQDSGFQDAYAYAQKKDALFSLKREIFNKSGLSHSSDPVLKIWLPRRNSQYRKLFNRLEIQEELELRGFLTVYPEELNLLEQIKLFSAAKVIVAEAGSALTNAIFAPAQCTYITLAEKFGDFAQWKDYFIGLTAEKTHWVTAEKTIGNIGFEIEKSAVLQFLK